MRLRVFAPWLLRSCYLAKWIALTVLGLSFVAWFVSVFFVVGPRVVVGNSIIQVMLDQGYLELGWFDARVWRPGSGLITGWFFRQRTQPDFQHRHLWMQSATSPPFWQVFIPWWQIATVLFLLTAILFLADRRKHAHGECSHCNYSLTGNTSGVCPECGTAVGSLPKSSAR